MPLAAIVVVLTASPALAKVPPFTVEIMPASPVAGEAFEITVRFWDDAAHTDPAAWPNMRRFDDLLWAAPTGPGHSSDEALAIDLRRRERGVYGATVVLPFSGRWRICTWAALPCGDSGPVAGYPGRIELTVGEVAASPAPTADSPSEQPPASTAANGSGLPPAVPALGAILVLGSLTFAVVRRPRGR
jgi:hypothetical protein